MRSATESVSRAALLGGAAFALYAATLSRQPTADSLIFALMIESGGPPQLTNLRHPLLHPLAWSFVELWRLLGWTGRTLLPLQVLNALGGAATVALVQHLATRVTGSSWIGLAVAAGLAVSGAMWLLSTEAEFVTVPLALNLALFDLIVTAAPARWARRPFLFGVGTVLGIAVGVYLSHAVLLPVAALAAHPQRTQSWRVWLQRLAWLAGGAAVPLLVVGALLARSVGAVGRPALGTLTGWIYYGSLSWFTLPHGAYGFIRSLLLYPGLGMNDRTSAYLAAAGRVERATFAGYYALAAGLAITPLWLAVARRRVLLARHRRAVALLALWTLPQAAFAFYWVPGDCSFWAPVLTAWWLLVALLLATAAHQERALAAVAALALILMLVNAVLFVLPRHDLQRNRAYWIAAGTAERTHPGDIIVTGADDILSLYLPYFVQRTVVVAGPNGTARAVDEALTRAAARGSRVFVVGLPPPASGDHFTVRAAGQAADAPVWEVVRY